MTRQKFCAVAMGCLLAFVLAGCESDMSANSTFPTSSRGQVYQTGNAPDDTIFGKGGIFGNDEKELQDGIGSGGGLGVNAYLWRASLDTISFMPLSSADPFGGVIITDWYSSPDSPNERFKVTVYILDRRLRADGVRVTAFKQNLDTSNQWIAIPLAPKVTADLENAILAKARDLRVAREGE